MSKKRKKKNNSYQGHFLTLIPARVRFFAIKEKKRNSLILGKYIRYVFMELGHIPD